ncbi:MAG: PAS-domain containing protein [Sneathiellaceae bacterium]
MTKAPDPFAGGRDDAAAAGRRDEDVTAALLREAGGGITQGLLVVDAELRIVFVNAPYRAFFGLEPDDPHARTGLPLAELLRHHGQHGEYGSGDVDAQVAARMQPVLQRRSWSLDRQQPGGRYLNITGNPLPSGGFVFTFTDVTERVRERERLDALVRARTAELEEVNAKLVEGIEYARILQRSTQPSDAMLQDSFIDHYLLFRPLDIVGGDFYFCAPKDYGVYFGIADCTGHGVPGALMTMLARTVLRQAVDEVGAEGPAAVLAFADRLTRMSLGQGGPEAGQPPARAPDRGVPDNGFDIVFCLLAPGEVQVAGAGLGLLWQGPDGIREVAGRRGGLGYARRRRSAGVLTQSVLPRSEVRRLFLATDGLYDHPGGDRGFGFGRRRWLDAVEAARGLGFQAQCAAAVQALEAYGGGRPRRDDVTFLALDLDRGRG